MRIAGPCPAEPFQLVPARLGLSLAGPYQLWCTSLRITTEMRPVRNISEAQRGLGDYRPVSSVTNGRIGERNVENGCLSIFVQGERAICRSQTYLRCNTITQLWNIVLRCTLSFLVSFHHHIHRGSSSPGISPRPCRARGARVTGLLRPGSPAAEVRRSQVSN